MSVGVQMDGRETSRQNSRGRAGDVSRKTAVETSRGEEMAGENQRGPQESGTWCKAANDFAVDYANRRRGDGESRPVQGRRAPGRTRQPGGGCGRKDCL